MSTAEAGLTTTAREDMDALYDLSQLLETGLDRETLAILVGLTEQGVNPEALAAVVKELRREAAALGTNDGADVVDSNGV